MDECQSNPCRPYATCYNAIGSFSCQCMSGYSGDGLVCNGMSLSHLLSLINLLQMWMNAKIFTTTIVLRIRSVTILLGLIIVFVTLALLSLEGVVLVCDFYFSRNFY